MIKPEQIPDEVVEAAARREHDMDFEASGDLHWPAWGILSDAMRAWRMKRCRAAIAAALNAWPEVECRPTFTPSRIILPLAQETDND
jgi:hypothetical protein